MRGYIIRRLLQMIPVLFLASVLVFLIVYLIPGDPAIVVLGPNALPEQIEATRAEMGLDRPLPEQYLRWLGRVLQGDLGVSFRNQFPVAELLLLKLPATIELTAAALLVAVSIAFPVGTLSAIYKGTLVETVLSYFIGLAYAIPTFWVGILLILGFGLQLRWLPASGYVSVFDEPVQGIRFLIMPALTLGLYSSAVLARFLKTSILESLSADYVRTARAKGLRERTVLVRHVLKNALIPVVTVLGLQFGVFMGGAVVTEAIFDWPGIGRMVWDAILNRDYTIVQATVLMVVTAFTLINLITDIVYGILDPRIRYN